MNYSVKSIPFSRPFIEEEEMLAVKEVLESGWLTTGPKTAIFEQQLADFLEVKHVVGLSSCTAALHLALLSAKVGSGDEVITSPLTFCSTVFSILQVGAKPVFADIDLNTLNLDPREVEKKITSRTKAILPVHYGGHPCRMNELLDLAQKKQLLIIEDAAHAIGSLYENRMIGGLDTFATCFSFYVTKNLSMGEGGALATNDDKVMKQVRLLSLHGMSHDAWNRYDVSGRWGYDVLEMGYKYNLTDIQAALGVVQLRKIKQMTKKRQFLRERYQYRLQGIEAITFTHDEENVHSAAHLFAVRLKHTNASRLRDELIAGLKEKGIHVSVHFIPIPALTYFKKTLGVVLQDFPCLEEASEGLITLPLYPSLEKQDIDYICDIFLTLLKEKC